MYEIEIVIFIEVNKYFWILEAINYFFLTLIIELKADFFPRLSSRTSETYPRTTKASVDATERTVVLQENRDCGYSKIGR